MSKILVEVAIPAAGERFDVLIPYEARVQDVTELVKSVLTEEVVNTFLPIADTVLCDGKTGAILDSGASVEGLGLSNGTKLLLV